MTDSCLVQSYDRIVSLSHAEKAFLHSLEEQPTDFNAGDVIAAQASHCDQLFAGSYTPLPLTTI